MRLFWMQAAPRESMDNNCNVSVVKSYLKDQDSREVLNLYI